MGEILRPEPLPPCHSHLLSWDSPSSPSPKLVLPPIAATLCSKGTPPQAGRGSSFFERDTPSSPSHTFRLPSRPTLSLKVPTSGTASPTTNGGSAISGRRLASQLTPTSSVYLIYRGRDAFLFADNSTPPTLWPLPALGASKATVIAPYIEAFFGTRTLPVISLKPPLLLQSTSPAHGIVAVSFSF